MPRYEVTTATYVPVGSGFKHKKPGQVVTLKASEAKKLGDSIKKLDDEDASEGVAKRNTPAGSGSSTIDTETVREVTPDASESTPADERAGGEAVE